MSTFARRAVFLVARGFTVTGLLTMTILALNPNISFAWEEDCEARCIAEYGDCKECDPPWAGTFGLLTSCHEIGGGMVDCHYSCGMDMCPPD